MKKEINMKRFQLSALALIAWCGLITAQTDISWQMLLGGSSTDQGTAIIATSDGGFITAATVKSIDGDITDKTTSDTLDTDIWLTKFTVSNVIEWKKSYGGSGDEYVTDIDTLADGGYLISGNTHSSDGDFTGAGFHGNSDIFIMKIDATGNISWVKCYGGTGYELTSQLLINSSGNYIISGMTYDSGSSGDLAGTSSRGWTDALIMEIDTDGNIIWKQRYGGNLDDRAICCVELAGGDYIFACEAESYAGSGEVSANIGNNHTYDFWILRTNASGSIIWKKNFGGTSHDMPKRIVRTADSHFIIAGLTQSNNYDATGNHGLTDGFLVKMDENGDKLWSKTIGGSLDDSFYSLKLLSDSSFLLGGTTNSFDGDISFNNGNSDYLITEIKNDGTIISANTIGSTEKDELRQLEILSDGRIIVNGYVCQGDGDITNPVNGYSDIWLAQLGTASQSAHSLTIKDTSVEFPSSIVIPVSVEGISASDNIISYQFDIDYDNTTLEYTGSDLTGTFAEGGTTSINSSVSGKLNISYMTSIAMVGAGDILLLQFNTLKSDTTSVSISNAYLNATSVTDLNAGQIIVKDVTPPTASITFDDTENRCGDNLLITATFSEPILTSTAMKISMSGGVTLVAYDMTRVGETVYTYSYTIPNSSGDAMIGLSNGTDLWGNEVVSIPTSGETFSIIPITYGDVDDDGTIFAYDAALTLQYSVGLDPLPTIDPLPWENWRDTTANVDGIGAVTANDAGMILQYSAGIITGFDASAKKSVSQGFISIEVIDNEIILYSYGDLLGLNISAVNEDQILDTPVILTDNLLSAFNISGTTYSIGICTANSPENGEALMKIPFTKSGSITLDMIINTEADARTLNLSYSELTGMQDLNAGNITFYPNPTRDLLSVQGVQKQTTGHIYNSSGQLMFSSEIDALNGEINVSALPSGIYVLKMDISDGVVVKRFVKE